jgi:hypothetical protein
MVLLVQGTTYPDDGGQGLFWYNGSSTAGDDNGVTAIVPTGASVGAWIRVPITSIGPNTVSNANLAQVPPNTLKGNNSASLTQNVADLTVTQVVAMLVGTTANTLAAGNDSRFTAVGQTSVVGSSYTLGLADQGTELYFTYSGAVSLNISALAWSPSAIVVLRAAAGTTVTIIPGSGMSLVWVPSNTTGNRTLTGPGLTTLSFATATTMNIGAGGVS